MTLPAGPVGPLFGRTAAAVRIKSSEEATDEALATSVSQGLSGAADEILFDACKQESRAFVTLDRDFGQMLRYPGWQRQHCGIHFRV
jgi:hypothetical protein